MRLALILIILFSLTLPSFARNSESEARKRCLDLEEREAEYFALFDESNRTHNQALGEKAHKLMRYVQIVCYQDKDFVSQEPTKRSRFLFLPPPIFNFWRQ